MENSNSSPDNEFKTLIQTYTKTMAEGIKISNTLPVGSARTNFVTCFPQFKKDIKPHSDHILDMVSGILKKEGFKTGIETGHNEEKIDLVVDGINKILDRVRDNLNVMKGITIKPSVKEPKVTEKSSHGSWNNLKRSIKFNVSQSTGTSSEMSAISKVIEKPQIKFKDKVDNTNSPFKPRLESKPNSIKPLSVHLEMCLNGQQRYCHPYLHELNNFKVPSSHLQKGAIISPKEIDSAYAVFVDKADQLVEMVETLRKEQELAVDLEHHSFHSYQGFTCLMQISTRETDYIVDTLALRHELHVLNEIFTNPNIVKVFHGAECDIIWLQKDLNLYIVNLFDTHIASVSLNFPRLNLAFLLKQYCNVESDKRYQLYDWRTRPLAEAALTYARSDTHYLLFIYDKLRHELIDKVNGKTSLLESVYSRGVELCKRRYEKIFDDQGYLTLYKQSKQTFDNRQMFALESLYSWRDKVAREEDESTGYVLPNHMLLHIAEILPREMQGILGCCNPVPVLVRKNLPHIHQLIVKARSQPLNKVISDKASHNISINKSTMLSKIGCPHDFSQQDDFRDNLATLFDGSDVVDTSAPDRKCQIPVLESIVNSSTQNENGKTPVRFMSPYERYKRTVEFALAQQEEDKEQEDNVEETSDSGEEEPQQKNEDPKVMKRVKFQLDEDVKSPVNKESGSKVTVAQKSTASVDRTTSVSTEQKPVAQKRKQKSLLEQVPNKKSMKNYDSLKEDDVEVLEPPTVTLEVSSSDEESIEMDNTATLPNHSASVAKSSPMEISGKQGQKKKKKNKPKKKNNNNNESNTSGEFTSFDYTQTNWNKFANAGRKNLKKLLNTKIQFGASKKNKSNQKFRKQNNKNIAKH